MAGSEFDLQSVIDETIAFITVRQVGDHWVGDAPDWFGERLFGGFVLAQAVHAATSAAAGDPRLHSLHAYFLRPVVTGQPLSYRVVPIREGRSFTIRHLEAVQSSDPMLWMTCSFAADTDGYEYELPMDPDVPSPDELSISVGPGPWEVAEVGPTPPTPDGTRASTRRAWFRIAGPLPEDANLHTALIAFATDMTGTGGRPLHLEGDVTGMVSIDHAAWFHRPLRADEWLYYDVHSLVNAGGRGTLRGSMYGPDGRLAASVAQEMLLRPVAL